MYSSLGSNEEVTLNCVFDGYPVPHVILRTFEEEINGSGSASFKFNVESQSDFRFYTCRATNSRGSDSYTIEVHERGIYCNNIHEKLLSSDWLRCVQFKCNTTANSVTTVQINNLEIVYKGSCKSY